jgi:hypothetical protein
MPRVKKTQPKKHTATTVRRVSLYLAEAAMRYAKAHGMTQRAVNDAALRQYLGLGE